MARVNLSSTLVDTLEHVPLEKHTGYLLPARSRIAVYKRLEAQADRIFPGGSVRQDFDLGTLTPGEYTAVVIADAGGEAVFGTRYTLNVGDSDTP